VNIIYYLRRISKRYKIEFNNQIRRITTCVYEKPESNMTTFTPDIYCWSGRCSSTPMGETLQSSVLDSASLVQHPLHQTFVQSKLSFISRMQVSFAH